MSSNNAIRHITDASFADEVLAASKPVLVDFWAEWCAPCKQIAPLLEEIAGDMADRIIIAKVNIDENPQTPTQYGVRGIPTLILFQNGQADAVLIGAKPKSQIVSWIESAL